MILRILSLSCAVCLSVGVALGQQPAAPPAAPVAPTAPNAPEISVILGSGNFLGVFAEDINKENLSRYGLREPGGVAVTRVIESSPAERAGLRKDDVILRFDHEPVNSVRKLNRLIAEAAPEQVVRLTISRGGREQELSATLGRRDEFPRTFGQAMPPMSIEIPRVIGPWKNGNNLSFVTGRRRRIGAATTQLTKQLADYFGVTGGRGLLVTSVTDGSPAAKAGLKAGDVIMDVDGNKIEQPSDLTRALNRKEDGEVTVTVIRDKVQRSIRVAPERGQSFEFFPGTEVMPQVGEISMPSIEIPISIPRIEIPMPRIDLRKITVPAIRVGPAGNPME